MSSGETDLQLLRSIPASVYDAKLGMPRLESNLFSKNSIVWRGVCALDLVGAAINGDTDAIEVLRAVETQAGEASSDGNTIMLPCGKRMGQCAVVLMVDGHTAEPVNCSEHKA